MVLRRLALPLVLLLALPLAASDDLEGVVRMPRAEYDKLKDAAEKAKETPEKKPAVVPPSVESAAYELRVSPDRIALELTADVVVKPSAAESRVTLPAAGLLDALTDKGPATVGVVAEGGKLVLVFPKPGRYRLGARFLPAETRSEGERAVDFTVLPAAAARLAGFGSDTMAVSVSGGPQEGLAPGAARSLPASALVHAVVRAPARIAAPSEKPLLLCDTVDVLRVERDRVTQRVFVRVSVTRAPLAELVLAAMKGAEVASLTGPSDPAWTVKEDGRIVVTPAAPLSGDAAFSLLLTRPAPGAEARVELTPTRVEGAASSRSYLLVDPNPLRNQETIKEGTAALSRVDVEDLPAVALPFASAGSRAYRVTGTGARLALAVPPRAVVAPPDTLLADAELLTVMGDGGSRVDRRRFVFETKVPHLDVPIPEGEEVLAVSVDGVPATPRVDGTSLVVSLPPSAAPRRVVEVTSKSAGTVPKKGELTLVEKPLPGVASLARWTVVLPEDRRYRVEKSDGIGRVSWTKDAPAATARVDVSRQNWMEAQRAPLGDINVITKSGDYSSTAPSTGGSASVNVQVTDTNGAALPGVSVELRGSAIVGTRTIVTDGAGRGFFPNLPAGKYTAVAALAGFVKVEKSANVSAGSSALLAIPMSVATTEEVVVTGEAPVVDVTKSSIGTTFNADTTPRGKGVDLSGLFRKKKKEPAPENQYVTGGVEGGVAGATVYGATSLENQYVVDGLSEKTQAGTRSLAMDVTGHGKRLLLSGPLVGAKPVSVTLAVKPE